MGCISGKNSTFKVTGNVILNKSNSDKSKKNLKTDKGKLSIVIPNKEQVKNEKDSINKYNSNNNNLQNEYEKIQVKRNKSETPRDTSSKLSSHVIASKKTNDENVNIRNEKYVNNYDKNTKESKKLTEEYRDNHQKNEDNNVRNKIPNEVEIKITKHEINNEQKSRPKTPKQLSQINDNLRKFDVSVQLLKNISRDNVRNDSTKEEMVSLVIETKNSEKMYPIMTKAKEKIKFIFEGQFKIDNDFTGEDFRSNNENSVIVKGFNLGVLLCRVGGEEKYFVVYDGLEYIPSVSGPLFFIINSNAEKKSQVKLNIKNVIKYTNEEIDIRIGWNKVLLNKLVLEDDHLLSEIEMELLKLINKLRTNPVLFSKIYLFHLMSEYEYISSFISMLINLKPMNAVSSNPKIKATSDEIYKDFCKLGTFPIEESKMNQVIQRMLEKNSNYDTETFKNIFLVRSNNPAQIILKLLLYRSYILLNETLELIGLSIKPTDKSDWICIIYFSEVV